MYRRQDSDLRGETETAGDRVGEGFEAVLVAQTRSLRAKRSIATARMKSFSVRSPTA